MIKSESKKGAMNTMGKNSLPKNNKINDIKKIEKETNRKIKNGLSKPTASTGTSISKLKGAAKFMAQLSNVGGGSKATGGKGIADGFNTIIQNQNAKTILYTISHSKITTNKTKKIRKLKKKKDN